MGELRILALLSISRLTTRHVDANAGGETHRKRIMSKKRNSFKQRIVSLEFRGGVSRMFECIRSLFVSKCSLIARKNRRNNFAKSLRLESLEQRQLFATLVNPNTVVWQDTDGDDVSIVFSKPVFTIALCQKNSGDIIKVMSNG